MASTTPAAVIVMAAGKGTRMRSTTPKVLHRIGGRSLLDHAVTAARGLRPEHLVVVVRHERAAVVAHLAQVAPDAVPGDQDEIRFRIMELWEARVCDIANWIRDRLAPHEAELNIPVKDFAHLVITLAMGYAHGKSPDTSLTPATLARLALDGARRKDSL